MAQSSSTWPIQKDGEDMPVQNMINELSKLVLAQMLNLQAENQDNWAAMYLPVANQNWNQ